MHRMFEGITQPCDAIRTFKGRIMTNVQKVGIGVVAEQQQQQKPSPEIQAFHSPLPVWRIPFPIPLEKGAPSFTVSTTV